VLVHTQLHNTNTANDGSTSKEEVALCEYFEDLPAGRC
jgi:hypothetical protein